MVLTKFTDAWIVLYLTTSLGTQLLYTLIYTFLPICLLLVGLYVCLWAGLIFRNVNGQPGKSNTTNSAATGTFDRETFCSYSTNLMKTVLTNGSCFILRQQKKTWFVFARALAFGLSSMRELFRDESYQTCQDICNNEHIFSDPISNAFNTLNIADCSRHHEGCTHMKCW